MKIDKAIEIISDLSFLTRHEPKRDEATAISLAIEALKRIEHCRKWSYQAVGQPLPGEDLP